MSAEKWNIDQAVARGPWDEEIEGCLAFDRYGIIGEEEMAGEPLEVALAQEEADVAAPVTGLDDQWMFVDGEESERALEAFAGDGPEAAALHLVAV